MLEYVRFLREEEKSHREYLETLYTSTLAVLGVLGMVAIGMIGFLQFKTLKDVKEAVDAKFRATVEIQFEERMEDFWLEANRKINGRLEELEGVMKTSLSQIEALKDRGPDGARSVPESHLPVREETPSPQESPSLTENEQSVLRLMGQSEYSFRSLIGITQEAKQKGINPEQVRQSIETLTQKGLIGKTLGKKGGERWYVTEAGRKYLLN